MISAYDKEKKKVILVLDQDEFDVIWRASYAYDANGPAEVQCSNEVHQGMCEASLKSGNSQC